MMVPLPLGHGAPYTGTSVAVLVVLAAVVVYSFRRSLGAKFALARGLAEELG
jgi:hypothetical protein